MRFTWKKALAVGLLGLLCSLAAQAQDPANTAAASPAPAKPAVPTPTVDQLLDHYVQAIGGHDAWMKLNSRVSKGSIEIPAMNNLTGTVEIHEKAPNRMLAVINLGGAVFEQGFDGTVAWSDDPQNGTRVLSGGELEDARREANFYHPLDMRKNYTKMTVVGIEKIDGHDTFVVEAIRTKCAGQNLFRHANMAAGEKRESPLHAGRTWNSQRTWRITQRWTV